MKKLLSIPILLVFICCSDGDLDIETIDFDSAAIEQCGTVSTSTQIFFKRSEDEALILNLQSGLLKNEATSETITSAVPSQSTLTYRIFNENISSSYFCGDFPPATPLVTEEIEAEDGEILISTVAVDATTFEHTIQLQGISLVNAQGERITDLSINDFGTITTTTN